MKYLGNLAVVPERSVYFECKPCQVSWRGCAAAFHCPSCGLEFDWNDPAALTWEDNGTAVER